MTDPAAGEGAEIEVDVGAEVSRVVTDDPEVPVADAYDQATPADRDADEGIPLRLTDDIEVNPADAWEQALPGSDDEDPRY